MRSPGGPELTGPLAHRLPERAAIAEPADPGTDTGRLTEAASAGQLAVRLFAGDPLLFSRASQQADGCARAGVRVEIVPGVSAATGVPGFAGIPLTADTGGLRVVHASDLSGLDGPTPGSLVVLGAEAGPVDIAKMLVAAGWADTTPIALTWNGTTTDQHTVVSRLGSVAADLKAAGVSMLTEPGPAGSTVLHSDSPLAHLRMLGDWALGRGFDLPDLDVHRPALEEVYFSLTGPGSTKDQR